MDKKLILIVEDEEIERSLLAEVLSTLGYATVEAENGLKALEVKENNQIDLVLSDIHMPEMNGLDLLKHLRKNGDGLPVILMTGFDATEAREVSEQYKAAALLTKPFRLAHLKELLEKLLPE